MLQIDKAKSAVEPVPSVDGTSLDELYTAAVKFVRRQFPVIIFVMLATVGLGAVYVFSAAPRYTATAEMIMDTHKLQLFQQQSAAGVDIPVDSATVDSQVEILKSENIALSVIKDLHLNDDPEFIGPGGGFIGAVLRLFNTVFASSQPASEFELTRRAVGRFESGLSVRRLGLTYVIEISYQSLTPNRAAEIANAIADAYVVDALEAKYQSTKRAATWLQDRMKELRAQAATAERVVVDFKAKNNIIDTGGRLLNEQQLAELNSALILARAQTAETKARTDRVQQILQQENKTSNFNETATVTDSLHDDVITRLRQQYLDISARESDWSTRYGRDHLAAVNLRNQMAEIRKSIDDELRRIAETYKSDYEIAKAREDSVQRSLNDIIVQSNETSQAQIELHSLDANAQSYRALADNFLQRYMESVQQQSFPITEARLITQASPPFNKSYPKPLLVMAMATLGGLFLAFIIGTIREFSDRVYRTVSQVENNLNVDCIAILPAVKESGTKSTFEFSGDRNSDGVRTILRDDSLLWQALNAPFSQFAESIRAIKMAGDLAGVSKSNKIIAITSSVPNEGKSTVAVALAQLIADSGSKTILVDCDLRNPSLTRRLARSANIGFIEVVFGKASLADCVWTEPSTKLAFLPAVVKTRIAHSSEILASGATKELFDRLREVYDYVIVDLSPMTPIVDVRATINFVDSYVFIVEWGRTKIDAVEHALNSARGIYDNLLGVVLNKADVNVLSRYESYQGKYYYKRYYSRYGYTEG
jgi:succinoglycan biosynthesis transport protein ExoP